MPSRSINCLLRIRFLPSIPKSETQQRGLNNPNSAASKVCGSAESQWCHHWVSMA
jgi:hypothetical protein